MLVLLYLEKIFIFTTSALLNPAAYFLGKTVWFTLTAVSITTPNFCYLHLVFWTGHILSIQSVWWFNTESVNIIYLDLKTSVVKKIQGEQISASQFLSWPTELLFGNIHSWEHIKTVFCSLCWLVTAYCSSFNTSLSFSKIPSSLSPGYVRDRVTFRKQVLLSCGSMEITQRPAGLGPRNWGHEEGNAKVINYTNAWGLLLRQGVVIACLCVLSTFQLQTETS